MKDLPSRPDQAPVAVPPAIKSQPIGGRPATGVAAGVPPGGALVGGVSRAIPGSASDGVPYGRLFRWGWQIARSVLGLFLLDVTVSLLSQTLQQYSVQVLSIVVSGLQTGGQQRPSVVGGFLAPVLPLTLHRAAIVFAIVSLLGILLGFVGRITTTYADASATAKLQSRLHERLLRLGPRFHSNHDLGEVMVVVTRYAGGAEMVLRDLIAYPLVRGIGLITALVFLAMNLDQVGNAPSWMRLSMLGCLVGIPVIGWWLSGRLRAAFSRVRDSELAVAEELTSSLSLPMEVQLMGAGAQRQEALDAKLSSHLRNKVAASARNEFATQFQTATPVLLQLAFLTYGAFYALDSQKPGSAGAILAIYYFVPQVVQPVQQLLQFFLGLNTSWPQVESVVEILETEPEVRESTDPQDLGTESMDVFVDDLTFAYDPGSAPQLRNLTHRFEPGKISAIVARAGMGKSTLLNLVARTRDPQSGSIRLRGVDIRNASLASLRQRVVKVSQFPLFLPDTIRANFRLAKRDASDAEIEMVCRRTGLWDVLIQVAGPHRHPLDVVLPRSIGDGLSGGQRRLLAVTRALLLQPAVLMLDEPTTGIDALGRASLIPVLRHACDGITVLLVDHDMNFVSRVADVVCVLEDGKFSQIGSPTELSATSGLFRDLLQQHGDDRPSEPATGITQTNTGIHSS